MHRTGSYLLLGALAIFTGCVAPGDRVPMNRGLQPRPLLGFNRVNTPTASSSFREPRSIFSPTFAANTTPASPLPVVEGDRVERPGLLAKREPLPRFFPGLFGQGQGDAERLAKAKSPVRRETDGSHLELADSGRRAPGDPDALPASTDVAVTETSAEVESEDADIPVLPIGLKVEAYPVTPSPTPPAAPPAEAKPEVPAPQSGADSNFLPIPGLDESSRPSRTAPKDEVERTRRTAESVEPPAHPGRPRQEAGATPRADPSVAASGGRFRVTPKPTAVDPFEQEPKRGPIGRLIRRWKGEGR